MGGGNENLYPPLYMPVYREMPSIRTAFHWHRRVRSCSCRERRGRATGRSRMRSSCPLWSGIGNNGSNPCRKECVAALSPEPPLSSTFSTPTAKTTEAGKGRPQTNKQTMPGKHSCQERYLEPEFHRWIEYVEHEQAVTVWWACGSSLSVRHLKGCII